MEKDFLTVFPRFSESDRSTLSSILEQSDIIELSGQTELLNAGSAIQVVPFVLAGSIKVLRDDREGHELYLYHIQPGESCAMTLTSTLSREQSRVKAVTLEKTRVLAVPTGTIHRWYQNDAVFRMFVLNTYHRRFEELLKVLDQVSFQQVDQRLSQLLRERARTLERTILQVTHQELAEELNSSREVVSRLLKQMEKSGMVELGRNRIKIIDLM